MNPDTLMSMLTSLIFGFPLLSWFRSYLLNRPQWATNFRFQIVYIYSYTWCPRGRHLFPFSLSYSLCIVHKQCLYIIFWFIIVAVVVIMIENLCRIGIIKVKLICVIYRNGNFIQCAYYRHTNIHTHRWDYSIVKPWGNI